MIRVGIYGGSGYTGLELMRILLRHPGVEVTGLTSRKFKGQPLSETYPLFEGLTDIRFIDASPEELAGMADVIFTATPHGEAMAVAPAFLAAGSTAANALGQSATARLARHFSRGDLAEFRRVAWRVTGAAASLGVAGVAGALAATLAPPCMATTSGTISRATMLMILISGLTAGPAVSL